MPVNLENSAVATGLEKVSFHSNLKERQCQRMLKVSEVTQSCPTLCDPMDCSLPGSSVHGIFQARVLEWVAISFWSGLPFPSPGDLPDPGIEPRSPALQADALPSEPPGKPEQQISTPVPWVKLRNLGFKHPPRGFQWTLIREHHSPPSLGLGIILSSEVSNW